jgi:hypothetical protein
MVHEGILKLPRVHFSTRRRFFSSAKTPEPISCASKAVEIALIELTLTPAVFVILAGNQAERPVEELEQDTVTLVTESGDVSVDLQQVEEVQLDGRGRNWDGAFSHAFPWGIGRQPYSDNCRLAWLCRDYRADPRDRDRILRSLSHESERTLTEAARECRHSADPISAVLSLVCDDFAEADFHGMPIGPTTRVRRRHRKGDCA